MRVWRLRQNKRCVRMCWEGPDPASTCPGRCLFLSCKLWPQQERFWFARRNTEQSSCLPQREFVEGGDGTVAPPGGLPEQPHPESAAQGPRQPRGRVLPGPARVQVRHTHTHTHAHTHTHTRTHTHAHTRTHTHAHTHAHTLTHAHTHTCTHTHAHTHTHMHTHTRTHTHTHTCTHTHAHTHTHTHKGRVFRIWLMVAALEKQH